MLIKKIQNKSHLQVTFSKRRAGLFKKASELCTLCGVEIAVIVFSPAGKAYSFGHLDVESVVGKFLTTGQRAAEGQRGQSAVEREMNAQLTRVVGELEDVRKEGELLGQLVKAQLGCSFDEIGLDGLAQLRRGLEELKVNVESRISLASYNFNNFC
ncbi:Agamous-like MADS-box protein AGL61 [Linum perenne]